MHDIISSCTDCNEIKAGHVTNVTTKDDLSKFLDTKYFSQMSHLNGHMNVRKMAFKVFIKKNIVVDGIYKCFFTMYWLDVDITSPNREELSSYKSQLC